MKVIVNKEQLKQLQQELAHTGVMWEIGERIDEYNPFTDDSWTNSDHLEIMYYKGFLFWSDTNVRELNTLEDFMKGVIANQQM